MEINILEEKKDKIIFEIKGEGHTEEKKDKIIFEIKGEGHTLSNAIRKELWNDEHVKSAAYAIEHPLIEIPRFIVDTDGADPRKTLLAAAKRVQKDLEKVKAESKELK